MGKLSVGDLKTKNSDFNNVIDSFINKVDGGTIDGDLTVTGTLTQTGAQGFEGNVTLGDAVSDAHIINGSVTQDGSTAIFGLKKFQSFTGTLAATNGGTTTYGADDVLVELGTLDTSVPTGHVAATKFFIDKVVIGITTATGVTSAAKLDLSATTGTATNVAVGSATEIVGAGVATFDTTLSAVQSITEIDIDLNATAGLFHVFTPNISVPIAKKHLYVATETALSADTCQAGRFTVMVEYTVY